MRGTRLWKEKDEGKCLLVEIAARDYCAVGDRDVVDVANELAWRIRKIIESIWIVDTISHRASRRRAALEVTYSIVPN